MPQNTAYDDLEYVQVEPRETSSSPKPHELESDDLPNLSPELGVPIPQQVDAFTYSFTYQAISSVDTHGSGAENPSATSSNASAEGSESDDVDDFPPPLDRWEQRELESRGATLSMIQTFHMRFDHSLGIIAWLDNCLMDEFASEAVVDGESWKVYLGREIHLHESDLDGSRYIFEIVDDSLDGRFTTFRAQITKEEDGLIVTCLSASLEHIPEQRLRDEKAHHDARKLLGDEAKKQWHEERAAETIIKNELLSDEGETEPEPATGDEDEDEDEEEEDVEMDGEAAGGEDEEMGEGTGEGGGNAEA